MEHPPHHPCTAFHGTTRLASGPLQEVVLAVNACLERDPDASVLTIDDRTGKVIDLDLRGTEAAVLARLAPPSPDIRGRGRPKLGVVAREVTLLPRHWDWLNSQPGGASVALRKLVEAARNTPQEVRREAQERTYRFMSILGGDAPGYEEALRALYAGDRTCFSLHLQAWPMDVRTYTLHLAEEAFSAQP